MAHQTSSLSPSFAVQPPSLPPAPNPLPLPALEQLKILEQLHQMRSWQQQQQAALLRNQQEQLARLRWGEPERDESPKRGEPERDESAKWSELEGVESVVPDALNGSSPQPPSSTVPREQNTLQSSPEGSHDVERSEGYHSVTSNISDSESGLPSSTTALSETSSASDELKGGGGGGKNVSSPRQDDHSSSGEERRFDEDRPIKPSPGSGSMTTFEQYVDRQLKLHRHHEVPVQSQSPPRKATPSRTFLRRGEGIARFGMKIPKIKRKGKPSGSTQARPPDVRLEGSVDGANNQTQHNLLLGKRPPRQSPPRSPSPLPPPPLPRSSPGNPTEQPPVTAWGRSGDETSAGALRPMRVRKVAQSLVWNGDQRNSMESLASAQPTQEVGVSVPPGLRRCSSEDSFLMRADTMAKTEQAELEEFELLERVTDDCSFSSQCSVLSKPLGTQRTSPHCHAPQTHPAAPSHTLRPRSLSEESLPIPPLASIRPLPNARSFASTSSPHHSSFAETDCLSPPPTSPVPVDPCTPKASFQPSVVVVDPYHPHSGSGRDWPPGGLSDELLHSGGGFVSDPDESTPLSSPLKATRRLSSPRGEREAGRREESIGLSHSVGASFGDEEAWESFNHGSPVSVRPGASEREETGGIETTDRGGDARWKSPVRREVFDRQEGRGYESPLPSSVVGPPITSSRSPPPSDYIRQAPYRPSLPPPSALISRLFPALKREREEWKKTETVLPSTSPLSINTSSTTTAASLSTAARERRGVVSAGNDTPPSSLPMSEELRKKLAELESEIERFRAENATIEKLRMQREKDLAYLKQEVAEFDRQKRDDVTRFEDYRAEETRKLKRDRRMLEEYQREARSARSKKDREEIESLRRELQEQRDDMQRREARWASTLARQRLRVEALEGRNHELEEDLKMVEQDRLQWWQQQIQEAARKPKGEMELPLQRPAPSTRRGNDRGKPSGSPRETTRAAQSNPRPLPPAIVQRGGGRGTAAKRRQPLSALNPPDRPAPSKQPPAKQSDRIRPFVGVHRSDLHSGEADLESGSKVEEGYVRSGVPSRHGESVPNRLPPGPRDGGEDCEIVDIVCRELESSAESCSDGASLASELSAMADEIVDRVLDEEGGQNSDSDHQRAPPPVSQTGRATGREGDAKKRVTKSVHFAASLPSDPQRPDTKQALVRGRQEGEREEEEEGKGKGAVSDGRIETVNPDGSRLIVFPNGTRKTVSADQLSITVHFFNGDIKQIQPDHTVTYFYSDSKTTHITYQNGLEIFEFPNNQSEKHYPDGTKEVHFPDKTVCCVRPSGEEESVFPDGSVQRVLPGGDCVIELANGQKEVHTTEYKRREYPDGTVKTVYPDGRQETVYASGRVRTKDKDGNILYDSTG